MRTPCCRGDGWRTWAAGMVLLAAAAVHAEGPRRPARGGYSLEQATSDRAQLHTMAFNGLAFLTGDVGSATFIPPGKVADHFGFQWMRDIDAAGKGHNPVFLDRVAGNVLGILSPEQRQVLEDAARDQEPLLREIALLRIPLVAAWYAALEGGPAVDREAVVAHLERIFELDARLSYRRARVFGVVAQSLSVEQQRALGQMKFGDFRTWKEVDREDFRELRPRGASKLVSVGFMTLASEFFSWIAGSVEADTYFCPERHGTYFGGFYLKDLPAMGQRDYDISTSLTGDLGEAFLEALTPAQRALVTAVVERQRKTLTEMVEVRRSMSTLLRGFLQGRKPPEQDALALGRLYGKLDAELSQDYAGAFITLAHGMDAPQKAALQRLRGRPARERGQAFLYSDRVPMPDVTEAVRRLQGAPPAL